MVKYKGIETYIEV